MVILTDTTSSSEIRHKPARKVKHLIFAIMRILISSYIVFALFIYFLQEKLLFIGPRVSRASVDIMLKKRHGLKEVTLTTPDNIILQGYWAVPPKAKLDRVILYFGGNGEEDSLGVLEFSQRTKWPVLGINYRGYGLSEGKPGQKQFFADAITIYNYLIKRGISPRKIIPFGRSLGSGVAVYLASRQHVSGIILAAPYDSIVSVAQHYCPFVPMGLIVKHRFNSIALAPVIHSPMLALIASGDKVIPPSHSLRLVNKWGGPAMAKMITSEDHDSMDMNEEYWVAINQFLLKM